LPTAARQRLLDRLVPLLAGATVFAFAAGSSSVPGVLHAGRSARWVLLLGLLATAAAWSMPRLAVPFATLGAAGCLVGLAGLSTAWSVEPRRTLERAVSLGLLFASCLLLAAAVRGRPDRASALLVGLLGGAAAVGIAGLVVLALDHSRAVEGASYESPARFRGFGQDPNTVPLLDAVVMPLAVWALLSRKRQFLAGTVLILLLGTIIASGSRGGLLAGAVGSAVVVAALLGRRAVLVGVAVIAVIVGAGAGIQSLPQPSQTSTAPVAGPVGPAPKPGYLDAEVQYPLDADIGRPLPGGGEPPVRRSLFSGSGRVDAWRGALHEVARRPVAGHGFGTEQDVFVDRYYRFVGGLPENSYIGLGLQLGAAGLFALAVLLAVLGRAGVRALRGPRKDLVAACGGVLAAGLAIAVVQSYLYSVGNLAAAALWIPAFMLATVGADA
jgi:hypothetical protein